MRSQVGLLPRDGKSNNEILRHRHRIPGAAKAFIEAVECRDLFGREFEVEYPCVLRDPVGLRGLGDYDDPMLERPSKQNLRVRAAVLL